MDIDDFEIPEDDGDYPITPAEEILKQTRQALSTGECVIYSLYCAQHLETTLSEATELLSHINAYAGSLCSDYIWSRERFSLHIVEGSIDISASRQAGTHKEQNAAQTSCPYFFLQGCTVYADCIDDEWFVVYLLHKISIQFPQIYIRIGDRDGEFLLIEAADVLPRWIQPENAANRVWIRGGYVHLLSGDALGCNSDGEGIDHTAARCVMGGRECLEYRNEAVTNSINQRISVFPEHHLACRHTADVILPRRCAAVLQKYPSLLSTVVSTLCDGEEATKKDITDMSCIGASDFVSISVVFTRIQYAQMMFQNLELPALLRLAEKRLAFKDRHTVKAFDVGARLACGTEAVYQKAKRLRSELKHWNSIHSSPDFNEPNYLLGDGLSGYTQHVNMRCLDGVESAIHNTIHSHESEGPADQIAELPAIKPHSSLSASLGSAVGLEGRAVGESDSWLYLTPEAMDKELAERVSVLKGTTSTPPVATGKHTTAVSPPEPLQNMVKGLDQFIAGESGYDGVDMDGDGTHDSDYFSDEQDTDSSESHDDDDVGGGGRADDDGDIVLNIDKLMCILEDYQAISTGGNAKTNKNNTSTKSKSSKKKKSTGTRRKRGPSTSNTGAHNTSSVVAPVVSGTGTYMLSTTATTTNATTASGLCTVEDVSDSDSDDINSDSNSDDVSRSSSGSEDDVPDKVFYKEYQEAMDGELSGTTLDESFLRQGQGQEEGCSDGVLDESNSKDKGESGSGATVPAVVDEELNMLTHLLESHASQFGSNGPVGNILGAMGISLPNTDLNTSAVDQNSIEES